MTPEGLTKLQTEMRVMTISSSFVADFKTEAGLKRQVYLSETAHAPEPMGWNQEEAKFARWTLYRDVVAAVYAQASALGLITQEATTAALGPVLKAIASRLNKGEATP